jgi:two-component sensor histidine kinase
LDAELERVCGAMAASMLAKRPISLTLSCEAVELSARRAGRVCLIISGLIINALRHAFSDKDEGAVVIDVRVVQGSLACVVSDNAAPTRRLRRVAAPGYWTRWRRSWAARLAPALARGVRNCPHVSSRRKGY